MAGEEMASIITSADGLAWTLGTGLFSWVLDTIACGVPDPALAAKLREIIEFNLGGLDLRDCSPAERDQILAVLCTSLLPAAEREFPADEFGRRPTINHLRALVKLCCTWLASRQVCNWATRFFRSPS